MNKRELGRVRKQAMVRVCALLAAILLATFGGWKFAETTTHASNPASGSISATTATPVTWVGNLTGAPPAANGEPSCVDTVNNPTPPHNGNCDWYALTVNGNPSDWVGKRIRLRFTWTLVSTDYDMIVRKESNGVTGPQGDGAMPPPTLDQFVDSSARGTSTDEEVILSPADTGTGVYYVRALYFSPNAADQYNASAAVYSPVSTAPTIACSVPTFDNYQPPVALPNGSPYPRRDSSGEPSVGVNWNTGNVMSMSRLRANRTTFNDATSPADPTTGTIWFSQTSQAIVTGLDPIGFTDPVTGRSIYGELQGAAGITNGGISDDDLTTFTQTFQTGGPTQGIDHQTIGGGPAKKLVDAAGNPFRQPTGSYPRLFYYASQQSAYASVATSFDGGITYQPAVPAYTLAQCTNLHGHIKVAPDGTVYLPNRNCGGKAAMVVSENNGLTWSVRAIPTSSAGKSDAALGIGAGGKVYASYTALDNHPHVAVSDDKGLTWHDDVDFATLVTPNFTAAVFPAVVAGDSNRAAVFFHATSSTQPGDPVGDDTGTAFKGTWFPYIATTCDGGKTWSVVRADNDPLHPGVANPVQQGVICTTGTTCPGPPTATETRNLLDFMDMAVDARGRIVAVYADGCNFDSPCIGILNNSADKSQNQGIARLTLIRQRGGSRLFSEFDAGSPSAPLAPFVEAKQSSKNSAQLLWGTPDDRGSAITNYRIYRGSVGKGEKLLATVKAGVNSFIDREAKSGGNYYYHVTAVNAYGESRLIAKTFISKSS